jgi:hypothetical protein
MPEAADYTEVECAGCRKVLGLTTSVSPVPRIYCSAKCEQDFSVSLNESRDDLIFNLLHLKTPKGQIAESFGLSRQRIIQLANARKREGTLSEPA